MRALSGLVWAGLMQGAGLHAAPVVALVFSPDGGMLVGAAGDKVLLASPESGKTLQALTCEGMRVTSVAFEGSGKLLAVGGGTPGEKGTVLLFDWRTRKRAGSVAAGNDVVTQVAFSPDGRRLAAAGADKVVRTYKVVEGDQPLMEDYSLRGHAAAVEAVAYSPDGDFIVTASLDRSVKVWSAAEGKLLRSFGQHTDAVHGLAFRPGRDAQPAMCATGGDDNTVRIWQPGIGRMVRIVRGAEGPILALAFATDGQSLFAAGQEGIVRQIDAGSDEILRQWKVSSDWIHSLAVSPDGRFLAAGDWAGKITLQPLR